MVNSVKVFGWIMIKRTIPISWYTGYLLVLTMALGMIARRFEAGWFSSVNLTDMVRELAAIVGMSLGFANFIAPFVLISMLLAIIKIPGKIAPKQFVLFLPFIPFAIMLIWISFVKIRFSDAHIFGFGHWTFKVFEEINLLQDTHFTTLATFIAFFPSWSKDRLFGLSVLLIEYCFFYAVRFVGAMACSNVWL